MKFTTVKYLFWVHRVVWGIKKLLGYPMAAPYTTDLGLAVIVCYTLEVCYENALYKFTFHIYINIQVSIIIVSAKLGSFFEPSYT